MRSLLRGIGAALLLCAAFAGPSRGVDVTYTYDSLGRLTSATYACSAGTSYTYDAAGNRTASSATASSCQPSAANDTATTAFNTAVTFDPRVNDSDPNGYALTITGTSTPGHGGVTITGGASVTYTPTTGYSGTDSFTYTISNGHGGTASAFDTVTVWAPPVAVNDNASTTPGAAVTFDPRANDSDANGFALTIASASTPGHGSVAINSGASVTYTPTAGYSGTDSFTYTISDGHGGTASATDTMTISSGNSPPVANDDSATTTFRLGRSSVSIDPTTNDTDVDGDALTVTAVTGGAHGTCSFSGNTVSYFSLTGIMGYHGPDVCAYTISDGHGHTASANVNITIP